MTLFFYALPHKNANLVDNKAMEKELEELVRELALAEMKLKQEAPKNIGKNLGRCLRLREKYNTILQK